MHPHHLPHGAFEGRVPDVAVGPFTQNALTREGLTIGGHANWLRGNEPRRVETWQHTSLRLRVNRQRRIFQMDRVEHAVASVIRIEGEAHQPTDKSAGGGELWKQPWRVGGPVEVDVRDCLPSGLVDDGERSRVFGDEQPPTTWLFDEDIDSRSLRSAVAGWWYAAFRRSPRVPPRAPVGPFEPSQGRPRNRAPRSVPTSMPHS